MSGHVLDVWGGGREGDWWLPAGGICASQGTFSSCSVIVYFGQLRDWLTCVLLMTGISISDVEKNETDSIKPAAECMVRFDDLNYICSSTLF